jgi:hypothetical protein
MLAGSGSLHQPDRLRADLPSMFQPSPCPKSITSGVGLLCCMLTPPAASHALLRDPRFSETHTREVSPDKSVNLRCTTGPFTACAEQQGFDALPFAALIAEASSALLRCAPFVPSRPTQPASYGLSVRRLAPLHFGFVAAPSSLQRSAGRLATLGSDPTSRLRPCLRLVLLFSSFYVQGTFTL